MKSLTVGGQCLLILVAAPNLDFLEIPHATDGLTGEV